MSRPEDKSYSSLFLVSAKMIKVAKCEVLKVNVPETGKFF